MKKFWNKLFLPFIALLIAAGAVYLLWPYIMPVFTHITLTMWLVALFGFLFFMFNEFEDECVRSNWKYSKHFLNTNLSWKKKWKLDSKGHVIPTEKHHWYHFGVFPTYIERFPYSSTILVFLTDGEHLFQFLKKRSIDAAFLVIDWRLMVAWMAGVMLFSFIKEKILKTIQ